MIRRQPRSTHCISSAASDVYKRQAVLPLSICRNVAALWDPKVAVTTTCGNMKAVIRFAYYSNTFNSATDLFLAVFPTVVFWNLNLKLRIKISLIGLLSLGIV